MAQKYWMAKYWKGDRQIDRWKDGWMVGWVGGWTDRQMEPNMFLKNCYVHILAQSFSSHVAS